tara:strand:- start:984 stop:1985 length:1002 start_codon:yes stop_codon:yes gene_type:complete
MTIFNTSTRHADGFPSPATDLNSYLTTSINETNFDSNYVTHCFRPTGDGAGIYYNIEHPAPSGDELWIHFNFKYNSPNTPDDGSLLVIYDSLNKPVFYIAVSNGNLYAYVYGEGSQSDLWNEMQGTPFKTIDIRLTTDGLITKAQLFIDTVLIKGLETPNVVPTVGKPTRTLFNVNDMSYDSDAYVSEIIIADEETRGMRLAEFSLTTPGTYSQFDEGDLTTSFDNIENTFTRSNNALQKTSGTIGAYTGATINYEIKEVRINTRGWKTPNSSIGDFRHFIRTGGNDYENTTLHTISSETRGVYTSSFTTNPATLVDWTFSDLVGLESGLKTE